MGDPKKQKKKYTGPSHPWIKSRIDEERVLMREYRLKNKKELWKMESKLTNFKNQVKKLTASISEQAEKEKELLRKKLESLDLLRKDQDFGEVLALDLKSVLDRRLETRVFKKGLSRTMKQARQFIVHGHVEVNGKIITSPSYVVNMKEDQLIKFVDDSRLSDYEHPERVVVKEAANLKKQVEDLKKKDKTIPKEEKLEETVEEAKEDITKETEEKIAIQATEKMPETEQTEEVREEIEEEIEKEEQVDLQDQEKIIDNSEEKVKEDKK